MTHNAASETFAHAQTHALHACIARLYPAALSLRCQGGRVGCRRCQRRPPLRLSQGHRVQLAVPTSVQSGLKTGMKEACRCCVTLDLSHEVQKSGIFVVGFLGCSLHFDTLICVLHLQLTGNLNIVAQKCQMSRVLIRKQP